VVGIDQFPPRGDVARVEQALHRDGHEVGISHVPGAVGVRQVGCFEQQVQRAWRSYSAVAKLERLEQHQHLLHRQPARRWRRHREDPVPAIGADHRGAFPDRVGGEILGGHASAALGLGLEQRLAHFAPVQHIRTLLLNQAQRSGQVGLTQHGAFGQRMATRQEHGRGGRPRRQLLLVGGDITGQEAIDREAVVRKRDRRLQSLGQRPRPKAAQRRLHVAQGAGHADRGALLVRLAEEQRLAVRPEELVSGRGGRRNFASVKHQRLGGDTW
jgi:hypothetical protein